MAEPDGPTIPTRVEITVAGHTVVIESAAPLPDAAAMAYTLFMRTEGCATRSTVGFDLPPPETSLSLVSDPDPSGPDPEGAPDAWRMGRKHPARRAAA